MDNVFSILGLLACICLTIFGIPFMIFIVFPFFHSLTPERKLEKYIDEQCLQGNEIAIRIRCRNSRFYDEKDYKLIQAAIAGNVNAIKALKLDTEKNKYFD